MLLSPPESPVEDRSAPLPAADAQGIVRRRGDVLSPQETQGLRNLLANPKPPTAELRAAFEATRPLADNEI